MNRQILTRGAVRRRTFCGQLLPDHREYLQQDDSIQGAGLLDGDCRHSRAGRVQHLELEAFHWNPRLYAGLLGVVTAVVRDGAGDQREDPQSFGVCPAQWCNHRRDSNSRPRADTRCHHTQGTESVPIVIVGNKSDLRPEQRQVSAEDGKKLSEKIQCGWTEASARYNENVGRAFELLVAQIEKSQNPGEAPEKSNCHVM